MSNSIIEQAAELSARHDRPFDARAISKDQQSVLSSMGGLSSRTNSYGKPGFSATASFEKKKVKTSSGLTPEEEVAKRE